jgi:hypothetical protein
MQNAPRAKIDRIDHPISRPLHNEDYGVGIRSHKGNDFRVEAYGVLATLDWSLAPIRPKTVGLAGQSLEALLDRAGHIQKRPVSASIAVCW